LHFFGYFFLHSPFPLGILFFLSSNLKFKTTFGKVYKLHFENVKKKCFGIKKKKNPFPLPTLFLTERIYQI